MIKMCTNGAFHESATQHTFGYKPVLPEIEEHQGQYEHPSLRTTSEKLEALNNPIAE